MWRNRVEMDLKPKKKRKDEKADNENREICVYEGYSGILNSSYFNPQSCDIQASVVSVNFVADM